MENQKTINRNENQALAKVNINELAKQNKDGNINTILEEKNRKKLAEMKAKQKNLFAVSMVGNLPFIGGIMAYDYEEQRRLEDGKFSKKEVEQIINDISITSQNELESERNQHENQLLGLKNERMRMEEKNSSILREKDEKITNLQVEIEQIKRTTIEAIENERAKEVQRIKDAKLLQSKEKAEYEAINEKYQELEAQATTDKERVNLLSKANSEYITLVCKLDHENKILAIRAGEFEATDSERKILVGEKLLLRADIHRLKNENTELQGHIENRIAEKDREIADFVKAIESEANENKALRAKKTQNEIKISHLETKNTTLTTELTTTKKELYALQPTWYQKTGNWIGDITGFTGAKNFISNLVMIAMIAGVFWFFSNIWKHIIQPSKRNFKPNDYNDYDEPSPRPIKKRPIEAQVIEQEPIFDIQPKNLTKNTINPVTLPDEQATEKTVIEPIFNEAKETEKKPIKKPKKKKPNSEREN